MKRSKVPDYRDKMVFGVPPIVNVQRTGQPLPQSIQQAMRYLRSQCLDQVGSSTGIWGKKRDFRGPFVLKWEGGIVCANPAASPWPSLSGWVQGRSLWGGSVCACPPGAHPGPLTPSVPLQVGIFRKSGVKSRIQALRHMNESSPDNVNYSGQSAYDVADLLKQYFRDLPEPIFTSKLTDTFLQIYQCKGAAQGFWGGGWWPWGRPADATPCPQSCPRSRGCRQCRLPSSSCLMRTGRCCRPYSTS